MTILLTAFLLVAVLAVIVWVSRRDTPDEAERRRTAEQRLRDLEARNVRRKQRKDDW